MKHIIVITGATASGKSFFAEQLAQEIGGEIINADIGSFYKPLTIGTAKPDWENTSIPHHLFDFIDEPRDETVVSFRSKIIELCEQIWLKGKTPIIVGGSTMYIKSLFYTQEDIPTLSSDELEEIQKKDNRTLWKELSRVDLKRAREIGPEDTYRLQRAVAIWKATGKKPSNFSVKFDPIADFYFIEVTRDREELYSRIDQRVQEMMGSGWLEEVRPLLGTEWEPFLMRKKMMGYNLLLQYLKKNDGSLEFVTQEIQKLTRNYAKRQITFYKKLKKQLLEAVDDEKIIGFVQEYDLTFSDLCLYIKQLSIDLYEKFSQK